MRYLFVLLVVVIPFCWGQDGGTHIFRVNRVSTPSAQWWDVYRTDNTTPFMGTWHFMGALDSSGLVTIVGKDTTRLAPYSGMVVLTILQFYDAYAKECYADSSQRCFNVYQREDGESFSPCSKYDIDLGIDRDYRGERMIWVHRQPTFDGFLSWLRTKTSRKDWPCRTN